ncbi:AAA domain containing protein [uncultured Caudovirales phage]|uniref:AAA domain containing protein n=1 Tax=uncultured Caudovirales phage TaxID=2100421 RepID=A0A6J5MES2_9CAUD|nr:AAA domain containing protein [uncultured Caudovirales phage]CAB4182844.1 AAA domain containing protein [uncultured Caudovirales phage]CAB4212856.1 AAA domain containing protein [uncultured Caudovirales phage]
MFRKAERKQAKLRLALCAPSGAGKTYSALLLAKGLGGKVVLLDTENGSGDLYADLMDYDIATISGSFEPAKYIDIIKKAEKAGYDTIIIDSLSHAWNAEGGILDTQSKIEQSSNSKNGYFAWRNVTPLHNALVTAILQSKMHVICTMRTKTAYEMQTGTNGKLSPVKIGLAPIQRDGMEYEFTVVLDVCMDNHLCSASKDRTRLFDGKHFVITENTGVDLLKWLNDGVSQEQYELNKFNELSAAMNQSKSLEELKRSYQNAATQLIDTIYYDQIVSIKEKLKSSVATEIKGDDSGQP